MKTEFHKTADLLPGGTVEPPIDLAVIPNHMGINLVSVYGMSWTKQDDGQLVSLTIHFVPNAVAEVDRCKECLGHGQVVQGRGGFMERVPCPYCKGTGRALTR